MMLFEIDFARKDMALESSSNSSSLGFSLSGGSLMSGGIGSATVSASYHDSSDVKSALKSFDEAAERANVESAGGSYDISRVKEEKHSSGFDFSVDAIGLAGLASGGGNSSTFSVPVEVSIEKDGDKSTFFMTSGNLGEAVLETANNFADAAKDMGSFGQSFMQNPGDTTAKLLNPLKGLVDEIGDRAFGKPAFKQTFVSTIDSDGEEYEDIVIEEFEKPVEQDADDAMWDNAQYEDVRGDGFQEEGLGQDQFDRDYNNLRALVEGELGEEMAGVIFNPAANEELQIELMSGVQKEKEAHILRSLRAEREKRGRSLSPVSRTRVRGLASTEFYLEQNVMYDIEQNMAAGNAINAAIDFPGLVAEHGALKAGFSQETASNLHTAVDAGIFVATGGIGATLKVGSGALKGTGYLLSKAQKRMLGVIAKRSEAALGQEGAQKITLLASKARAGELRPGMAGVEVLPNLSSAGKGIVGEARSGLPFDLAKCTQIESRLPGNKGIDQVFVKYTPSGEVEKIFVIESKFQSVGGKPRLQWSGAGETRAQQGSSKWVDLQMAELRRSGHHPELLKLLQENKAKIQIKANVMDKSGLNRWYDLGKYREDDHIGKAILTPKGVK